MKKNQMLCAVMVMVFFVFGQTAQAEQWKIYRGDKVIITLEFVENSVGHINHIKKTLEVNGKELLLPAEATMIEFPTVGGYRGIMYLNTTELTVRALNPGYKQDGDFFVHGYSKPLAIDDVIKIDGNTLRPRSQNRTYDTGGNERQLFAYDLKANKVEVSPGTNVEITVSTMCETKEGRRVEVTKKTIDF